MTGILDNIVTIARRFQNEIHNADWKSSTQTLDDIAGIAAEALLQADEDGVDAANRAATSAYADLVANHGVVAASGPQGLADQIIGLSRLFTAAMRKRRTLTNSEADLIVEDLTIRILRVLQTANRPVSNVDLAEKVKCRQETIARRIPQLRQARLVNSWPAGRSMFNEITDLGREALSSGGRQRAGSASSRPYVARIRSMDEEALVTRSAASSSRLTSSTLNVIPPYRSISNDVRENSRAHLKTPVNYAEENFSAEKLRLIPLQRAQSEERLDTLANNTGKS